jgi:ankyrin repeat protein
MKQSLPARPNIEHLKSQARDLHRSVSTSDPEALQRVIEAVAQVPSPFRRSDALFVIAREYGFDSWPKLVDRVRELELESLSVQELHAEFLGTFGSQTADEAARILTRDPDIARLSFPSALMAFHVGAVQAFLEGGASATEPTGDPAWQPILWAAFSPLVRLPEHHANMTETFRLLLARGANPNASIVLPQWVDSPLSVLYAAVGPANNVPLVELLLKAGAHPDDNESLYHSTEHGDHGSLRLLLQYGANPASTNALPHQLDRHDLEGLQIFLDAGVDPNTDNSLHHAIRRGRDVSHLELLVRYGGDPHRKNPDGVSAAELAYRYGRDDLAQVLPLQNVSPGSKLLRACWLGDLEAVDQVLAEHPNAESELRGRDRFAFCDAASLGKTDSVRAFLRAGFPTTELNESTATPLHMACFAGSLETVRVLVEAGSPLDHAINTYRSIPLHWAMYASGLGHEGEYLEIARLLMESGSPPPPNLFGSEEVVEYLTKVVPTGVFRA